MSRASSVSVRTADGLALESEFQPADGPPRAAVVLCHPHPQYGGTMRSIVISVLFGELPAAGYSCLRFNFRGVEGSQGGYDHGRGEAVDVVGAIDALQAAAPGLPIALVGWSFGGDMALSVDDARVSGWVGIAPPLRIRPPYAAATDARPKHLVLAEHDEVRTPASVEEEVATWAATTVAVVPGASHFFVGRTDRVLRETQTGLERVCSPLSGS
jgi:alpha/beta superfamily hydrolase